VPQVPQIEEIRIPELATNAVLEAASPDVRHRENLSYARTGRGSIVLVPDAVFPIWVLLLAVFHTVGSSIVRGLPKPVSSIALSIPLRFPRPAARVASPQVTADGQRCYRRRLRSNSYSPSISTSATITASIFLCTSCARRFPLSYKPYVSSWSERRARQDSLTRVTGYRRSTEESDNGHLFAQSRALRIRQPNGLDLSIVDSTSQLQTTAILL
jgi:hypothetical protein